MEGWWRSRRTTRSGRLHIGNADAIAGISLPSGKVVSWRGTQRVVDVSGGKGLRKGIGPGRWGHRPGRTGHAENSGEVNLNGQIST